ncbi:MAG: response regulator [Rhodobacteraceae bacterium]|nr:response regulator [Paracoccaceae bacterium]
MTELPVHSKPRPGQMLSRALILDDNEIDILRLTKFCRKAGLEFAIDSAQTITDMQAHLDTFPYDIVFIDYHLGFETGLDALRVLTTHPDQVEALPIMVTSVTDCGTAIESMRNGCADYLVKEELTASALQKSIASAFERRIVLSMISEANVLNRSLRNMINRFERSCGPDTRKLIRNLLSGIGEAKRNDDIDPEIRANMTVVEQGCRDVVALFDDVATLSIDAKHALPQIPRTQ